jgi:hypothetical protein
MESGAYSFYRAKAGRYLIHTTSDEHGVVCVGVIEKSSAHPVGLPWALWIDGKERAHGKTLRRLKERAVRILDAPYAAGVA